MALVITLYRLILVITGLGIIRDLVTILAPWSHAMSDSVTNNGGYIFGLLAFLGLVILMWFLPRVFLKISTENTQSLNIKLNESISFQQLAGLAVFLVGLVFFLYFLEQFKNVLVMMIDYYQNNAGLHSQGSYYRMILFGVVLFTALSFAMMYYHRRIARFFFRG